MAHVPVPFGARLRHDKASWVLELSGECDMGSLDRLELALARAERVAQDREGLIVDVSRLRFCDAHSAGLVMNTSTAVSTMLSGAGGIVKRVFDLIDPAHDMARSNGPAEQCSPPP
jgi:hypothetical protein